jgi:hypothetical protein
MGSGSASIVTGGVVATGGDSVTTSGGYVYRVFTTNGTFTLSANPANLPINVFVVGGGGAGYYGGGGGGRVELVQFTGLPITSYSITIGSGGVGNGVPGSTSQFSTIIFAPGGGGGGASDSPGGDGGCGGGGGYGSGGGTQISSTILSGLILADLGNSGGAGSGQGSGGGGGAMSQGGGASDLGGGNGGDGYLYLGSYYGAGGGGGALGGGTFSGGLGGSGSWGGDGNWEGPGGNAGGYGNGGGGGGDGGGSGSSGIVVISYPVGGALAAYPVPQSATKIWINGVQPSSGNYPFQSLYASGSVQQWTLNAAFLNPAAIGGTAIFYYGYILTAFAAMGGTVSYASGRKFHTFTTNGTFTITQGAGATIEIMAIGGGGGGGCQSGGGGGAGNMIVASGPLTVGSYSVAIGGGGAGGVFSSSTGQQGGSSTFGLILTALGGGGGGTYSIGPGQPGGCGGGGSELGQLAGGVAGFGSVSGPLTATQNLATNGGTGINDGSQGAAGGGGTSAAGTNHLPGKSAGNPGGAGTLYYGTYYGGGGGGSQGGVYYGPPYDGGAGGTGGGGTGSTFGVSGPLVRGTAGAANTGGGGGGATAYTGDTTGLAGGTGIVIVSYVYP